MSLTWKGVMKTFERGSRPPGTDVGHEVLIALSMAIALSLTGMTAWLWSGR